MTFSEQLVASIENLRGSLDFHLKRHAVLSANVANAETPGYRPQDLSFVASLKRAGVDLATSNSRHISDGQTGPFRVESFDSSSGDPSANGNAVSLEDEMAKLSANGLRYQAAAEMLKRRMGLIRYAATDGRGRA